MPKPTKAVPINNNAIIETERMDIPIKITISPIIIVSSFVNFLDSVGTKGDTIANANSGKLVNKPTDQFEMPISSRIIPINGPTEVIPGRKFIDAKTIPTITMIKYVRFCFCSNERCSCDIISDSYIFQIIYLCMYHITQKKITLNKKATCTKLASNK